MSTKVEKRLICPTCKDLGDIHKIIYGMPTADFDFVKYEVGGCAVLFMENPNWKCRNCGWEGLNKPRTRKVIEK